MAEPATMAMGGAVLGAFMDRDNPIRGAALGGLGGYAGGAFMGAGGMGGLLGGGNAAAGATGGFSKAATSAITPEFASMAAAPTTLPATAVTPSLQSIGSAPVFGDMGTAVSGGTMFSPGFTSLGQSAPGMNLSSVMKFGNMMPKQQQQQQQSPAPARSVFGGQQTQPFAQISPYSGKRMPSGAMSTANYF